MPRAALAKKFFTDILKIDKVEILKNLTKKEIIDKLYEIERYAAVFDKKNDDPQVVNSVFIYWVGFCLNYSYHEFMDQLDIDERIFPHFFPLT